MAGEEKMNQQATEGQENLQQTPGEEGQNQELQEAKKQIEELTRRLEKAEQTLTSPEYLEFLAWKKNPQKQSPKTQVPEEEEEEVDWDSMTQSEFAKYFGKKIMNQIRAEVEGMIGNVAKQVEVQEARADVERTAAKYPDFWNYRSQMQRLAQQYPHLTAEQAYILAKYEKQAKAEVSQPKAPQTPQQKPSTPSAVKREDLDLNEALNEAYKQVFQE